MVITIPISQIKELIELLDTAKWEIYDGQDFMSTLIEIDYDGSLKERMDSKDETMNIIKDYKERLEILIK